MLSPIQKKVASALNFAKVSNTNSVGLGTGPSSNVRKISFLLVAILQVNAGKNQGKKKGVRKNKISNLKLFYPTRKHRNIIAITICSLKAIQLYNNILMNRFDILTVILFKVIH